MKAFDDWLTLNLFKKDQLDAILSSKTSRESEVEYFEKFDKNLTLPIKLLIITSHRAGSSFFGELFNENKEAFYMFEPLAAVQLNEPTLGTGLENQFIN